MRFRAAAALGGLCVVLCAIAPVRAFASAHDDKVFIDGVGGAHGYGLAMDGVEGEADHGWNHDKILSLFYPGTTSSHFGGTIRVWLAEGGTQGVTLPNGGIVLDGPAGRVLATLAPGGRVRVAESGGTLHLATTGAAASTPPRTIADVPAQSPPPQAGPSLTPAPSKAPSTPFPTILPTAAPIGHPAPTATPRKTATPPKPTTMPAIVAKGSVYVIPRGNPALTRVDTTGRSYRGTIELRRAGSGSVRVINHVDLETYVNGIAEEKGAGWPPEAMKVLAIAARSLAASTMTWYTTHHGEGYDICNSDKCQVYLGYDGEAYDMHAAAAATSGVIRTYGGSPILAMYHGNGGGQTETYGPQYPYLRSVKYPFADPFHWHVDTSFSQVEAQLKAKNITVPDPLQLLKVLKRGDSPRVESLELAGGRDDSQTMRGTDFATALALPSTWFYFSSKPLPPGKVSAATISAPFSRIGSDVARAAGGRGASSWPLAMGAFLAFFVAASSTFLLRNPGFVGRLRSFDLRLFGLRLRGNDSTG
jgi:SpoIID/LytB domain protein